MSVRETLRSKAKPKVGHVDFDGERIHIRAMSGSARSKYMELVQAKKDAGGVPVEVIAAFGICEPDGTLAYDYAKTEDLTELGQLDAGLLQAAALKLFDLSGLTDKSAEDIEKK